MFFESAPITENFRVLRFVSLGGKWEIGLCPMMFGVRVRLGQVGSPCCVLDYCAGADRMFQQKLLAKVMICLVPVSEHETAYNVEKIFPSCSIKPIINDDCWLIIEKMAAKVLSQ